MRINPSRGVLQRWAMRLAPHQPEWDAKVIFADRVQDLERQLAAEGTEWEALGAIQAVPLHISRRQVFYQVLVKTA